MYIPLNIPRWTVTELTGYEPITTFWEDFYIAYRYGHDAIRDTYRRVMTEWSHDYRYMTELTLVLNHLIWATYERDKSAAVVFDELWRKHLDWVYDNFNEEELRYHYRITD